MKAIAWLALAACGAALAQPPPAKQRDFATPEAAASALCDAARTHDIAALRAILGRGSDNVIDSGDAAEDIAARTRFSASCGARTRIEKLTASGAEVSVGIEDWHLPFPLVKSGARWHYDTAAGLREILARRIGRNELAALQALAAYVEAQRDYALVAHDAAPPGTYAQRIASTAGRRDGLYWEPTRDGPLSPLGVLFALAEADAVPQGMPQPYHGYRFRVLHAQGAHAKGGALDYVVNGRMVGGFAMVAYPARYRVDGVSTFIVNHDGAIFSRDLGEDTAGRALAMRDFDPAPGWRAEPALEAAAAVVQETRVDRLAAERGCDACHAAPASSARAGRSVLASAPTYREIAARYRGRGGAEEALMHTVLEGTERRHWQGQAAFVAMVPNAPGTTPDEARALVRWILAQPR